MLANMLASVTGMRSCEILALRFQDIGNDCLYVRGAWNRADKIKLPKNNKIRTVELPFPDLIYELVELAKKTVGVQHQTVLYFGQKQNRPFQCEVVYLLKDCVSIRELRRQKESGLFLRLAVSKDKNKVLSLAKKGQIVESPEDLVKDVYVFEFLKIPEPYIISESDLETGLINNLQKFLLELGKGFTFVGRQYRIIINNTIFRVDLVFYHRILKCFVLIDLKINEVKHDDIGQMNMYIGYFNKEENTKGDNPPIGISFHFQFVRHFLTN